MGGITVIQAAMIGQIFLRLRVTRVDAVDTYIDDAHRCYVHKGGNELDRITARVPVVYAPLLPG